MKTIGLTLALLFASPAFGQVAPAIFSAGAAATAPTVTTTTITSITSSTASGGGNVTSDGGATVTARGACWNTSANPTTANSHTTDGSGTGSYTSSLTSLSAATLYHVRAYATNSVGTSYGGDTTFTTSASGFDSSGTIANLNFEEADTTAFKADHPWGHTTGWYCEPPYATATGTLIQFSTDYASVGSRSLKSYGTATNQKSRLWSPDEGVTGGFDVDSLTLVMDVYLHTWNPTNPEDVLYVDNLSWGNIFKLQINSSRQCVITTNGTVRATSSNAISLDTWTTIKVKVKFASANSYYGVHFGGTTTSATTNHGTYQCYDVGFGRGDQDGSTQTIYFDNVHIGGIAFP